MSITVEAQQNSGGKDNNAVILILMAPPDGKTNYIYIYVCGEGTCRATNIPIYGMVDSMCISEKDIHIELKISTSPLFFVVI